MKFKTFAFGSLLIPIVAGCTYIPRGPSIMALPGTGMSFEQFRQDDYVCQHYASAQVGGVSADQAARDSQIGSAAVGTALGAATGAALGGGRGAAIGAGTGLLAGSLVGSGTGAHSAYVTQQDYDNAFIQCMYAKGHKVPVSGRFVYEDRTPTQQAPVNIPPPPPGTPPPPPPR